MDNLISDIIPATPVQHGLLYIERSYAKSSLYHEQYVAKLTGNVEVSRLMTAWQKTVDAHTILRTIFDWDGQNEPVQVVLRRHVAPFVTISQSSSNSEFATFIEQDADVPFCIDTIPPHRVTLIAADDGTYRFVFTYHHLLLDGSSVTALLEYFAQQYNQPSEVQELNDYGVYTRWIQHSHRQASIEAWRQYASGVTLPPPTTQQEINDQTHEYAQYLQAEEVQRIVAMARKNHLTLNSIFQIMWAYTLVQNNGGAAVCVGSPTMIKPLDGTLDAVVGLCITTLPYITSFNNQASLIDIAVQHQQRWGGLIEHGHIGLADIKKAIGYQHYGDPFETILTYTDVRNRAFPQLDDIDWHVLSHNEITQYPLSLDVVFDVNSIELKATYRDSLYDKVGVTSLVQAFIENLRLFIKHPEAVPSVDASDESNNGAIIPEVSADSATVEAVVQVWAEVFGTQVGPDANFFDLGGDSISSLRIVSKLLESSIVISMRDIFDAPTPRLLAQASTSSDLVERPAVVDLPQNVKKRAEHLYGSNVDSVVRTSSVQQGIIRRPSSRQSLYHDQSTFTYEGQLEPKLFEAAWNFVIRNNDALRMQYFKEDEAWYACRLKERLVAIKYLDLRHDLEQDTAIQQDIKVDLLAPFDIQNEPLLRLRLYRTSENTYIFFLSFHILATDGWSFAFMMDDVFTAYDQLLEGQPVTLPVRRPAYVDYLQSLTPADIIAGRQHWKKYLQGKRVASGASIVDFSNLNVIFAHLNKMETDAIQQFAGAKGLTLNSIVQAAWAMSNARHSGPVVFGATTSARLLHGVHYDSTVGLFFNDIPIIAHVENQNVEQLAAVIQSDFQANSPYNYLSSYDIAEMLGRGREEAPYDSLVVFENYPKLQEDSLKETRRGQVKNTAYWRRDMADIPLTVYIEVRGGRMAIKFSYIDAVLSREEAQARIDTFVGIVRACTS